MVALSNFQKRYNDEGKSDKKHWFHEISYET